MGKYRATAEFNEENLPERVVTWIPNPVMGDMQVEIRYENWRDVGNGVKFPGLIHMHQGDHPFVRGMNFMNLNVSDVKVNVPNATPALPDIVRNAEVPTVRVSLAADLAGRVVPRRRLAQQRRRRVQGLHRSRRSAAERRAHQRGDRRGEAGDPEQADPLCRQHASSLGPFGRHQGRRCGRCDDRHACEATTTSTRKSCSRRSRAP